MPGFLSEYDEITTVRFGPVYWAKVRRYLRRADYKAAQAILVSPEMRLVEDESETKGKVDTGGYQDELVARALVEWNLTDETGALIPLGTVDPVTGPDATRYAAVGKLPEAPFDQILRAIHGQEGKKKTQEGEAPAQDPFPAGREGGAVPDAEVVGAAAGADAVPD